MTEPYVPQMGHYVTASVTGIVVSSGTEVAYVKQEDGKKVCLPLTATYERLPDPEPDWQPGDIVIDAEGSILRRRVGAPHVWCYGGSIWKDEHAVRPLTRLVRETPA